MHRQLAAPARLEPLEPRALLATYLVDSVEDVSDGDHSAGNLTLREAVELANLDGAADEIRFAAALAGETITLAGDPFQITSALSILARDEAGESVPVTLARDAFTGRLLTIDDGDDGAAISVTIEGLTLARAGLAGSPGGAIWSSESLALTGVVIRGCEAADAGGGAIYLAGPGSAAIAASTLTANTASLGGAIYVERGATLSITTSTLDHNTADGDGGAIWTAGALSIENSTISTNSAADAGGGIAIEDGLASLMQATLAYNSADADGDDQGTGGAIFTGAPGTLLTHNSLIANNTVGSGSSNPDEIALAGGTLDAASSYNLVADAATAAGLTDGVLGNIVGTDAMLYALDDNGGPTTTHELVWQSPAIDAASPSSPVAVDQRGESRPFVLGPDIGAYERTNPTYSLTAHEGARVVPLPALRFLLWNEDGHTLIFESGGGDDPSWLAQRPADSVVLPSAITDGVYWTQPTTFRHVPVVGAATGEGFLLYYQGGGIRGTWIVRNLSEELGVGDDTPVRSLTRFTSRTGIVVVAGLTADGDLVAFQQIDPDAQTWAFVNISDDLASQGMQTPVFTELTSYVTSWDAWNIAGIDAAGDIQDVWVHPRAFTTWRVDNLSQRAGAPALAGQLVVNLSAWDGIHFGGVDADGHLRALWWVPGFGGQWEVSDLTEIAGGAPLALGGLTGYVARWGAMHYIGQLETGEIVAYWWNAGIDWTFSTLSTLPLPQGVPLSSAPGTYTFSIYAVDGSGDVVHLWWDLLGEDDWHLQNITATRS